VPKTLSPADIEAFRNRLCDVAEGLFAAHGPDGVTMRELAEAMGVSSMTPYRYFEDKDAILAAVRTRAFNRFAEAMETASKPPPPMLAASKKKGEGQAPAGSAPGTPGNAYLDFALGNRAAYRMMFDVDQPTAEKYPELVAAMDRARLTMGAGLHVLAADGRFKGDIDLAAHMFWSAMHGPVMLELAGLLSPPLDARTLVRPMLRMLAEKLGLGEI
jgi:AcrR family transcriptional regulator